MRILLALFLTYILYILIGPAGFHVPWEIIFYRAVRGGFAILAGASLSLSGVMLQALFSNPLVEPYILGVSSGATTGSLVAIFFLGLISPLALSGFSFLFSLLTVFLIFLLSAKLSPTREILLLTGISVGSTLTALNSILMMVKSREPASDLIFWLLGSLSGIGEKEILVSAVLLPFFAYSFLIHRELDLLLWGQEAESMGLNIRRSRVKIIIISTALTATVVSLSGVIGFVGLISPHISRKIYGWSHRKLIPASMGIGGLVLLSSDFIARNLISPAEVPVGLITSLVGAPLFLYLVMKRDKGSSLQELS